MIFIITLFFSSMFFAEDPVANALNLARSVVQITPVIPAKKDVLKIPKQAKNGENLVTQSDQESWLEYLDKILKEMIGEQPSQQPTVIAKDVAPKAQVERRQVQRNQVSIETIPVLQQGGEALCGYHALKNILILMHQKDFIDFKISDETKKQLNDLGYYESMMNHWNDTIKQITAGRSLDDVRRFGERAMLQGNEIDHLIEAYVPENIHVVVLERQVQQKDYPFTDVQLHPIQRFLSQDQARLGIVWNIAGAGHHWVGLVVVKNGINVRIYQLDSAGNGVNSQDKKILIRLFSSTPEEIRTAIAQQGQIDHMQEDVHRLKNNIHIMSDSSGYSINKISNDRWMVKKGNDDPFSFNPNQMLANIYRVCLKSWSNYSDWPESIQREITSLLIHYFRIASGDRKLPMLKDLHKESFDLMNDLDRILEKLPATQAQHAEIRQLAGSLIVG